MDQNTEATSVADPKVEDAPKEAAAEEKKEQKVTAFEVEAGEEGVDYDKLIQQFGCDHITDEHLEKIEKLSGMKAHRFLRRKIFFSHRSLNF